MAKCALKVRERHLDPLSGALVVLALADKDLPAATKEKIGRKLAGVAEREGIADPGEAPVTRARLPVGLNTNGTVWKVG